MSEIFTALLCLAGGVGTVTSAGWYENGFMTADGVTADGKKFTVTLNIKEAEDA